MAITPGASGWGTVTSTGTELLTTDVAATSLHVKCMSSPSTDATSDLLINIRRLHGDSTGIRLEPGDSYPFRYGANQITSCIASAVGSTTINATVSWGVGAKFTA